MFIRFRRPFRHQFQTYPTDLHRFWWLAGVLGIGLVSAASGGLFALVTQSTPLQQRTLSSSEAAIFSQAPRSTLNLDQPLTLMVIGTKVLTSDVDEPPPATLTYHAPVNSLEGLSDTLLLLRFDPENQRLVVLSIPRDTLTFIPGRGDAKINEANALGGPALTAETLSELLGGIPIDRYLRINVQGVTKLIDALGGVTVYVPQDLKYRDDSQRLNIDLQAGPQHLDGETAMDFLRFRYDALGDIGRVQRQQALLRALVEQTLKPETLTRIPQIVQVTQESLDTNLSLQELGQLAGFMSQLPRSRMQMLMLPGYFNNDGQDAGNPSYWLPRYGQIPTLVNQHFRDEPIHDFEARRPQQLRIAIQPYQPPGAIASTTWSSQGSTHPEIEPLIERLQAAGYGNVYQAQAWTEPQAVTRIIAQQGDLAAAQAIRIALGFGEIRVESTGVLDSDITLQLGQDVLQLQNPPEIPTFTGQSSGNSQEF